MTRKPTLIYCAAKNSKFAVAAMRRNLRYGAQLPAKVYHPPYFVDNDWNQPDRAKYMAALKEHRPAVATVLDFEYTHQYDEVMSWMHEASQHVRETVIVIPKLYDAYDDIDGWLRRIPREVCGKEVRLGYPVPLKKGDSRFAGRPLPEWCYGDWPVHLLGGSPQRQHEIAHYVNVVSIDNNYTQSQATSRAQFFAAGGIHQQAATRYWPKVSESVYSDVTQDAPYLAFELSCMNLHALWNGCKATIRFAVEADIPAIVKIARQYRSELGYVMTPALRESLQRQTLVVAEYSNRVVGFVNYYTRKRDGVSVVYEIAVERSHKGSSIGRSLLDIVPRPVRLKCPVILDDNRHNPANDFYAAYGLRHAGTEPGKRRALNIWTSEQPASQQTTTSTGDRTS